MLRGRALMSLTTSKVDGPGEFQIGMDAANAVDVAAVLQGWPDGCFGEVAGAYTTPFLQDTVADLDVPLWRLGG